MRDLYYSLIVIVFLCNQSVVAQPPPFQVIIGSDDEATQVVIQDGDELDKGGAGVIEFEKIIPGESIGTPRLWMASGRVEKRGFAGAQLGAEERGRAMRIVFTDVKIGPSGKTDQVAFGDISISSGLFPEIGRGPADAVMRAGLEGTYVKMGPQLNQLPAGGDLDLVAADWFTPVGRITGGCRGSNCPGSDKSAKANFDFNPPDKQKVFPAVTILDGTFHFTIGPKPAGGSADGIVLPESAFLEVVADCNTNGRGDDFDLASGDSTDLNDNGRPDECDIRTVWCPLRGTGEGGTVTVNIDGFSASCTAVVDTAAGQSAKQVVDSLATTLNGEPCFLAQNISASAVNRTLQVTGFDLQQDDLLIVSTDPGIEVLTTVLKIPTLSVPSLAILVFLLLTIGIGILNKGSFP